MYNPYRILGVSSLESLDSIKKRYRELSRKYHPDNLVTGDADKFHEVETAWKYIKKHSPKQSKTQQTLWCHKTLFTIIRRNILQ